MSCRMKVLRKGDGQHIPTDFTCNMIYYMIFADMIELYCPRIHCADGKSLYFAGVLQRSAFLVCFA